MKTFLCTGDSWLADVFPYRTAELRPLLPLAGCHRRSPLSGSSGRPWPAGEEVDGDRRHGEPGEGCDLAG
ncbi:hypothetical protein Aph02nite_23660 [Actinoplanes philippinensis]|uniref:Uncharacterized protein n=1 Tax=Actinoplanes philippinensis TaxID=35752 RepID=A0A1I2FZ65_9ACTN|nr:hypothetical protein [Actinoplanes philippinensis]GIE76416.1 hypothetical protein Aph02nite_23660 [Actinoplanes philippinensis]SFF10010.1 hypothetical protein SAMN05421541_10626 [Actinoplanes philippinensis]